MADNTRIKRPLDADRINVHEAYELDYWTRTLDCSREQLEEAVSKVGTSATAVREYFKR